MAKPLPVGTLRFLCLGLHSEFGIAATEQTYALMLLDHVMDHFRNQYGFANPRPAE